MPTLDWIGKKAVVNHHREVPYHVLRCDSALSVGEPGSGNLLVQGDNLLALKALLPYYAGKVKCIYIDPPYNTGEEKWIYNDAVNSPEIKAWLGKVVGKEAEDLSRHDKWLCMMYPRLMILKQFLHKDGAIVVSIDDNEVHNLRLLLDEALGPQNFVANIVWQKRTSPDARATIGAAHDYLMIYALNKVRLKQRQFLLPLSEERSKAYKNPDNDPRDRWASVDMTGQIGHATDDQFFTIVNPANGKKFKPPKNRCWAYAEKTVLELIANRRVWFGKKGTSRPRFKKFHFEAEGIAAWTWWPHVDAGHNQEATKELASVLGASESELEELLFETPKPTRLLQRIVGLFAGKDGLVLDSFAGSGTTGHAVLKVNNIDGGTRKFVLIEMEDRIARSVASRRLANAISGYEDAEESKQVSGLGGGFRFCRLGPSLLDANGQVAAEIKFDDLARHVWFCETGEPWPVTGKGERTPLLGSHKDTGIYLLFNGVLGDRTLNGGNVLTTSVLAALPKHKGPKVIYGEASRLGKERLKREGIVFKQIPYEVKGA